MSKSIKKARVAKQRIGKIIDLVQFEQNPNWSFKYKIDIKWEKPLALLGLPKRFISGAAHRADNTEAFNNLLDSLRQILLKKKSLSPAFRSQFSGWHGPKTGKPGVSCYWIGPSYTEHWGLATVHILEETFTTSTSHKTN